MTPDGVSAEEAQQQLIEGNWRFMTGIPMGPNRSPQRLRELVRGQHPFAAVLGCSDSRVPPELIFDAGLGDLFVVRCAGNLPDASALGSLEYAASNLQVRLAVVLGHTGCGLVGAAVQGSRPGGQLERLLDAMRPAVEASRADPGEGYLNIITANVRQAVRTITRTPGVLEEKAFTGDLAVAGAVYHIDTGEVVFLPDDDGEAPQELP